VAARAWAVGVIGLFAVWIAMEILTGMIGTMWGVYNTLNSTGLIDRDWNQKAEAIKQAFLGVWNYMPMIVFASFIVYIIIESLRRRPEDYYV
jgi:hypothetical protein